MSQNTRILNRLKMGQMCSTEPLEWQPRIVRVAARVKDLRDQGFEIETETTCGIHGSQHALYRLVDQDQGRLFA